MRYGKEGKLQNSYYIIFSTRLVVKSTQGKGETEIWKQKYVSVTPDSRCDHQVCLAFIQPLNDSMSSLNIYIYDCNSKARKLEPICINVKAFDCDNI
jgi:hypothetical protein